MGKKAYESDGLVFANKVMDFMEETVGERVRGLSPRETVDVLFENQAAFAGEREFYVMADALLLSSMYLKTRQAYRLPRNVVRELKRSSIGDFDPNNLLARLPFNAFYVDTRGESVTGRFENPKGFLYARIDMDGNERHMFGEFGDEMGFYPIAVPRGEGTFGEKVERSMGGIPDSSRSKLEGYVRECHAMASICAYIASVEEDVEVLYREGGGGHRRSSTETVSCVGHKMGRALGEARVRYESEGKSRGGTVRPHVRQAHWANVWVGPRKGRTDGKFGDHQEPRWIPPVFVMGDGSEIEVLHG